MQEKNNKDLHDSFRDMDQAEKEANQNKPKERHGLFDKENPVNEILSTAGALILANIYFVLCSLPIVTMGASLTALNRVCYEMVDLKDVRVTKTFFKSFAQNVIDATLVWIIGCGLISGGVFGIYFLLMKVGGNWLRYVGVALCALLILFVLMILSYYFMLLARYKNDIVSQIKNALIMGVLKIGWTFLIWIVWGLPIALFLLTNALLIYGGWIWLLVGFAALSYITCHIYRRVFAKVAREA